MAASRLEFHVRSAPRWAGLYASIRLGPPTFASLQLFDVAVATLTVAGVLGLFALFSAGGALFCYAFVVETRGAALSDVQRLFSDQPPSEGDALLAPRV